MVKKSDKEFQAFKDKYNSLEMNISEDRNRLEVEKSSLKMKKQSLEI